MPSTVFQDFFAQLADAVCEEPERVANALFSNKLITRETRDKATLASSTPYQKATSLLCAVDATIRAGSSDKNFKKICEVLSKLASTEELSAQMMKEYIELVVTLGICIKTRPIYNK